MDVSLRADADFQPSPGSQFVKLFAPSSHTVSTLQGPVVVEGGVGQEDRSLKVAVMLPTETPTPAAGSAVTNDEDANTDTLVVHDDGAQADQTAQVTVSNISGMGMGTADVVEPGIGGAADKTIPAGINYHGVEVVNLMMGSGNDTVQVDDTPISTSGSFTFAHDGTLGFDTIARGSGNWFDEGYRVGDRIAVTGVNEGFYYINAISVDGATLFQSALQSA